LKDSLMLDDSSLEDSIADNRKFDVLVEALWEVVKDYIDKWDKEEWYDGYDWDSDY
jgi:hypothetical protein